LLKERSLDGKLPLGLLDKGTDAINDALEHFNRVKRHDSINEQRPKINNF
jgi:hypothetical protein